MSGVPRPRLARPVPSRIYSGKGAETCPESVIKDDTCVCNRDSAMKAPDAKKPLFGTRIQTGNLPRLASCHMKEILLIGAALTVAFSGYIRNTTRSWPSRHDTVTSPRIAAITDPASLPASEAELLRKAVDSYLREPTTERLSNAWERFSSVDSRLADLKRQVAATAGGVRAEAEVDRLNLQMLRDRELARFSAARNRFQGALFAFDALSNSIESGEGLQKAAAILAHGRERGDKARAN